MAVTGKYEFVEGTAFEDYLKASGVSPDFVEIGKALKPTLEFTENADGSVTMKITTELSNKEVTFKFGEELTEKTPDGRTLNATFVKEGGHVVQKQTFDNGFTATLDHEFTPSGLVLTYSWNGGKATRHYKRV